MPTFNLPVPKTRKEYFMAIAAGGEPGVDFPVKYDRKPEVKHYDYTYEETLEAIEADGEYAYAKDISDFVTPSEAPSVKINGKNATQDIVSGRWSNEDGYLLGYNQDDQVWFTGILSETELSGDALNVTVETFWDDNSDEGDPLSPKTIEEAYYANLAQVDVATALSKMQIKTRKDQYLNAMIQASTLVPGDSGK